MDIIKKIKQVKDKFIKKKETTSEETSKNPKLEALMKEKEQATAKGEPWVAVLDTKINQENIRNGFFELDWNDEFVNMLRQSGYQGQSEEEIVDRWFQTLCRTIGNEQGIDVTGSGYVQINRRDDGKTEVS